MMSKAELGRRAGISVLTVDRIERGENARLSTLRKILEALGVPIQDREKVFPTCEESANGAAEKKSQSNENDGLGKVIDITSPPCNRR